VKAATESAIVRACLGWLKLHGILAWRTNNIPAFDVARQRFRRFHGLRGVSDIIGCIGRPGAFLDGRLLAVEVKKPGGKLSTAQGQFLDGVRERGGIALVVTSVRALEEGLRAEGIVA